MKTVVMDLNGLLINNSFGYYFDRRTSVDLNVEYDHYMRQELNFLPIYLGFNYNTLDFDDVLSYYRGLRETHQSKKNFEKGTLY